MVFIARVFGVPRPPVVKTESRLRPTVLFTVATLRDIVTLHFYGYIPRVFHAV